MKYAFISWGTWIRTKIDGFKGRCPTVRRSPKKNLSLNRKHVDFNINDFQSSTKLVKFTKTMNNYINIALKLC